MRELITTTPPSVASSQDQKDKHRDLEIKGGGAEGGPVFRTKSGRKFTTDFFRNSVFFDQGCKKSNMIEFGPKIAFCKETLTVKTAAPSLLEI